MRGVPTRCRRTGKGRVSEGSADAVQAHGKGEGERGAP